MKLDHSLPTDDASGLRTARWKLALLATQSQAPHSQAAALQVDEEIHALCKALIASEGPLNP